MYIKIYFINFHTFLHKVKNTERAKTLPYGLGFLSLIWVLNNTIAVDSVIANKLNLYDTKKYFNPHIPADLLALKCSYTQNSSCDSDN